MSRRRPGEDEKSRAETYGPGPDDAKRVQTVRVVSSVNFSLWYAERNGYSETPHYNELFPCLASKLGGMSNNRGYIWKPL